MKYVSESGGVCNMALKAVCAEYGLESGGVSNIDPRVEVCEI